MGNRLCLLALVLVPVTACVRPDLTACGEITCPNNLACDGHGRCVLPEQLAACGGVAEGNTCSYHRDADTPGYCMSDVCQPKGCGNLIQTPDEVCDDGNTDSGDGCSADCKSLETCGNAILDPAFEECDDGNASNTDNCHVDCKLPVCGDGILDSAVGEECDDGAANSSLPDAQCRTNCRVGGCGDQVLDTDEVCDDGNHLDGDDCSANCLSDESCGNGTIDFAANEECEDGNNLNSDACVHCRAARCGDGYVQEGLEECDGHAGPLCLPATLTMHCGPNCMNPTCELEPPL